MDPHSPPPYAFVPSDEDINPYVEKVFDELWLDTLPNSRFAPIHETIVPFIHSIRDGVSNSCCPAHKTTNMSTIRSECYVASHCHCDDNPLLHEFFKHLVGIFDKHMSRCMFNVMAKKMLHERQN